MPTITLRPMAADDAEAVSAFLPDLGYRATPEQIRRRFAMLLSRLDNGLFVAVDGGQVVGWCHVYGVRLLESDGYAEIGGLVVAAARQQQGVGRQLVYRAEQWAADHGYGRVRLRSGVHREDAHQFYERLGYVRSRASYAFERHFPAPPADLCNHAGN